MTGHLLDDCYTRTGDGSGDETIAVSWKFAAWVRRPKVADAIPATTGATQEPSRA
jgi:hypothetical protein